MFLYQLKRHIKDLQDLLKYFTKIKKTNNKYELADVQIYPNGNKIKEYFNNQMAFSNLIIEKNTKIASIGTCFAEEISTFFSKNKQYGNYIQLEKNIFNSSANWGRVYTTRNLLQIIEYSFHKEYPVFIDKKKQGYFDLLREYSVGTFHSEIKAEKAIITHREVSKKVFSKADILAITLGQNEGWIYDEKKIMLGAIPDHVWFIENRKNIKPFEIDYFENLKNLERIIELLVKNNPKIKIILTISPVPSWATFIGSDVVTQSMAAKSILRAIVHAVVGKYEKHVFYFPSYEMVLSNNKSSYLFDNRHVRYKVVNRILNSFKSQYFFENN